MRVIPEPVSFTGQAGSFTLSPDTVFLAEGVAAREAEKIAAYLRPATGFALPVQASAPEGASAISLRLDPALADLGEEGYELVVRPEGVGIRSAGAAGLFYGGQSLRQLLPSAVFAIARQDGIEWSAPACLVRDEPRFRWRGAMLDCCRHFMPLSFVKQFIDLLALHKLNSFHWHLSEDQGWRLEIRKYPRLTEVGAWRDETLIGHNDVLPWRFDGTRHGGYYSQDEAREVVAYAAERHINVVPEIEMPGHASAAVASYPELGNTGEQIPVARTWGVHEHVFNVEESTISFLQDVLDEVLAIFPSPYVHVGGDECPKKQWRESPRAQERMRELGLRDENELQSWFVGRMDAFLHERGRKLVGWDEILEGGLAPHATVMSWRGTKGGIAAARAGHDVVMASNSHTYLDHYQSLDRASEPLAISDFLPLEKTYAFDPVPAELTPEEARRVLGSQGQLWTEYMETPGQVQYMAFPRLTALSEAFWTPTECKDYASFRERLGEHLRRLEALGVNYRKPE